MHTISHINDTNLDEFMNITHGIFEHSPWIAQVAFSEKPFSSLHHLHQCMVEIVKRASTEQQLALIKAHPNLGERISMTNHSTEEQKGAGLQNLTNEEYEQFIKTNQEYMEKFGFPFILAVRGKNKHEIYKAMNIRISSNKEMEFETALTEIFKIALLRLEEIIK
ncbi:2-oxo-4-hydroxy-4-carboxy-5-ureidoimidazoline decarboxylase [Robertmurraya korlensis]|uniref:2-oxo-4-hydroxy-4-carboxy-5-ureidoimidazoline decarboxylase n=1 Tax=Robertmurraya korlensis TaxID=519977 RepID=UPI002041A3A5|nr:2-oxo-4-hydroxy-4-carboxy-5-ureidoimidazoline decarboxylase [Robertmurraya korlensis]MCM3599865.1 2-oxo-4-hydroxy-4-carboxy-5-ureidoimidazoline decarboxylase [Robertmurraya korlensis]